MSMSMSGKSLNGSFPDESLRRIYKSSLLYLPLRQSGYCNTLQTETMATQDWQLYGWAQRQMWATSQSSENIVSTTANDTKPDETIYQSSLNRISSFPVLSRLF